MNESIQLSRTRRPRSIDRRQKLDHERVRQELRDGTNATWWTAAGSALRDLEARNALDIALYEWAADRMRRRLMEHWRVRYPGKNTFLPDLPCSASGARCWKSGLLY